jgi:hypothetical protein
MASTSSPRNAPPAVLGAPRPRVCHIPECRESAGDEAIELAALAGLELDDWQQFVLRHSLGERTDGKWAAKTAGLVVGRQNGKGSILEARELWGLFLGGERHIIHTAHLQKTATNHFERVLGLVRQVPDFRRRIVSAPRGKGSEAIILHDGAKIEFMTRARGNTRGLTVDLMVFDEAMYLSEQDRNAMVPTMAAQSMHGNTQTWYVGSAVDQEDGSQDGLPFSQVRESGMAGTDGVAWFEWSVPGDSPERVPDAILRDPAMWALANPGLGIRISHEWVLHELTVEMGRRGFAVERLGIGDWPDPAGDSWVIPREAWNDAAEFDESNRITSTPMFAVDANPGQTWASIAVAGGRDDGLGQFAVVEHDRTLDWVVDRCVFHQSHDRKSQFVVDTRGPAAHLIPALKKAGVRVLEANTEDYGNACGQFFDAVVQGNAKYPNPQPELEDALASAQKATLGDRWKWMRRSPTSADISPLVAATLALWGHSRKPPRARVINPYDYV